MGRPELRDLRPLAGVETAHAHGAGAGVLGVEAAAAAAKLRKEEAAAKKAAETAAKKEAKGTVVGTKKKAGFANPFAKKK